MKQNENIYDRLLRTLIGGTLLVIGYLWIGGILEYLLLGLGVILICTALIGFCPLYSILKINTKERFPRQVPKLFVMLYAVAILLLLGTGAVASGFFSKKIFLEDFNRMNNYYKQTLFNTGQDKRAESIENYEKLKTEYALFSAKYLAYKPFVLKYDGKINTDLTSVSKIIADSQEQVYKGDLKDLHYKLEEVRPVFQDLLKRNGFSMLGVALVDFHDSMEVLLSAADAKDPAAIIRGYSDAEQKMKTVEEIQNDDEIRKIRINLETLLQLAKDGKQDELPKQGAEMKSSFIKVYLKNN